jgi:tetratricopeptide (TPR) repeat protein
MQKKYDEAIATLSRAISICTKDKLAPAKIDFLGMQESCYRGKKNYKQCEQITRQMLPLCSAEQRPETYYRLAIIYFLLEKRDDYLNAMKNCVSSYEDLKSKSYIYSARLRELGQQCYQSGHVDEGLPYLQKSLSIAKASADDENCAVQAATTASLLGLIKQGNSEFEQACGYFRYASDTLLKLGSKYKQNYKSELERWLNCTKQAHMDKETAEIEERLKRI